MECLGAEGLRCGSGWRGRAGRIFTPVVVGRVTWNMADAHRVTRETADPGVLAFLEQVQRFGLLDVTF